jgi:hypothetical protein
LRWKTVYVLLSAKVVVPLVRVLLLQLLSKQNFFKRVI